MRSFTSGPALDLRDLTFAGRSAGVFYFNLFALFLPATEPEEHDRAVSARNEVALKAK